MVKALAELQDSDCPEKSEKVGNYVCEQNPLEEQQYLSLYAKINDTLMQCLNMQRSHGLS